MPKLLALHQPLDGNHEFWVDGQYIGNCEKSEHAQQIVKCVNMHGHMIKALRFARAEFDRISYQKKADPKVLEFMDMVLAEAEGRDE